MLNTLPLLSSMPAPAAAPPAAHKAEGHGDGESFSKALNDAAEPEAPAPGAKPGPAHPPRARARGTEAADARRLGLAPHPAGAAPGTEGAEPGRDATGSDAATDERGHANEGGAPSDVSGLLADIQSRHARAPVAASLPSPATAAATGDPAQAAGHTGTAALSARPALHSMPALPGDAGAGDKPGLSLPTPIAKADAAWAADTASATAALQPERSAARIEATVTSMPAAALQAPAPGTAAAEGPAAEAAIPAPLHSPDFAPQLGATISTFVRDGVGHARLHLNPAEMGPVSVQIQLDGQNAQVMLGAEHADTRLALEQSLPLLAGSLREAGLTLAGGGVFEQGQQARQDGEGRGPTGPGGDKARRMETLPPLPQAAVVQRRGVVDLVA